MTKPLLSTTIRPQDDFFHYVNDDWLSHNPVPASEGSWGTFYILRDQSWKAVDEIVTTLRNTEDSKLNQTEALLKNFFISATEFDAHEKTHLETITREMTKINAIEDKSQLAQYLGYAHRNDFNMFWSPYVGLNDKDSQVQVLHLHQGGLGLPNRDYYLDQSDDMKKIRTAYEVYQKIHAVQSHLHFYITRKTCQKYKAAGL